MKNKILNFIFVLLACSYGTYAQRATKANFFGKNSYLRNIPSLSKMDNIISAKGQGHKAPPKRKGKNTIVPGKGFPKKGDPLMERQMQVFRQARRNRTHQQMTTTANFDAHKGYILNDPTGAIGPNHYVYAFNSGFGILDRAGNVLVPEASLATLFPGEDDGDPIVMYDQYADRFIIMQFAGIKRAPNRLLIAVCKGADPVNDGWYTYSFKTGSFPDYEKMSIWSDGYYITANKDQRSATTSQVVFALERDKMLKGETAQIIGFPLPGIVTTNFYSPGGFNVNGPDLPPAGVGHQIVYMQDDAWSGVNQDHLKIWTTQVDWTTPANSTISAPQELKVAAFDGVFDNGSFSNLDEPKVGPDIDALQATMMFMTNYRRFATHNSVVMNFVVDLDGQDAKAGIRWYELRQNRDGALWTIYQEGTYVNPDGHSAFCGSINMDKQGNIGLGYTIVSSTVYTSLRYTGRLASDPLGVMTLGENMIVDGDVPNNRADGRYGDYAQITMDPTDDLTFWQIGEYMKINSDSAERRSRVVAFKIGSETPDNIAPSKPKRLTALEKKFNSVTLSWQLSADNVGVVSYEVFQGDSLLGFAGTNTFVVRNLTKLTRYKFKVRARDAKGNVSGFASLRLITPDSPFCLEGITKYPYAQSFENGFGDWTALNSRQIKWKIGEGSTPGFHTGPDSAAQGRYYAYVTRQGYAYNRKQSMLMSPCFNLSTLKNPVFSFKYHLASYYEPGGIKLEASKDNGASWETLWVQKGSQGNAWKAVQVNLSAYVGTSIQLRFKRLARQGSSADIAIDDIKLEEPENCFAGKLTFSITFDQYPEDISWILRDAQGNVIDSADYAKNTPTDNSTITKTFDLSDGQYSFLINDAFGDGLLGNLASWSLKIGDRLIATSEGFVDRILKNFCIKNAVNFCENGITNFPYTEGFENNLGNWTQTNSKGLRWASVKPGHDNCPNIAPNATEGEHYAYVHPWRGNPYYPSILTSPCFDLTLANNPVFNFKYFMNAPFKTGTLNLEVSSDNGNSWKAIWGKTGNQGYGWKSAGVSLHEYLGKRVQLRFVRSAGFSLWSTIAVDDLVLSNEGVCSEGDINLSITMDAFPEQVSWELKNEQGQIVDSLSYTKAIAKYATVTRTFKNLSSGNYTFTIKDARGNGICCTSGQGSYTLSGSGGVIAGGFEFRAREVTTFCVLANRASNSNQADRVASNIQTHRLNDDVLKEVTIYPNPATDVLNIKTGGQVISQVKIFSMYGRLVKTMTHNARNNSNSIDISNLSAGTYFVRLMTKDKQIVTRKFLIVK